LPYGFTSSAPFPEPSPSSSPNKSLSSEGDFKKGRLFYLSSPKLGTCLIVMDADPGFEFEKPDENIEVFTVEFNAAGFSTIIDRLT